MNKRFYISVGVGVLLLLSSFLLMGCLLFTGVRAPLPPTYREVFYDAEATAVAPWKEGEVIARGEVLINGDVFEAYRVFVFADHYGHFHVQDFYGKNDQKLTDYYGVKTTENVLQPFFGIIEEVELLNVAQPFTDADATFNRSLVPSDSQAVAGRIGQYSQYFLAGMEYVNGSYKEENGGAFKKEGRWEFHDKRSSRVAGEFLAGRRSGHWVYWYEMQSEYNPDDINTHHRVMQDGNYWEDQRVGVWCQWDRSGLLISEKDYGLDAFAGELSESYSRFYNRKKCCSVYATCGFFI